MKVHCILVINTLPFISIKSLYLRNFYQVIILPKTDAYKQLKIREINGICYVELSYVW